MGGCISSSVEFRNRREINPFYATHQHFRLADVFPTRYASDFQVLLKPAISTPVHVVLKLMPYGEGD